MELLELELLRERKARHAAKLAYLTSPARAARPNLSTPQAWWGDYAPSWAHSTFHLEQLRPRELAVQEAHEVIYKHYRRKKFAFEELAESFT